MLTDKVIAQAKQGDKLYRLSDGTRNGLSIEIPPAGTKRWRFRYRVGGVAKMISLGIYPSVTLKEAREQAAEARKVVERGLDPANAKRSAQAAQNTFAAVAKQWFDLFAATHSERYAAEVWSRLEREVFPFIGTMQTDKIDAPTVLSVLRRTESRGLVITMYKIKSHISQIFKYAIACGLAYTDPSRDLSAALTRRTSKSMPTIIDPQEVGRLLVAIDGYRWPVVRAALKLAALTFVRPGELRRAEWPEINIDTAEWRIPAEKMKMRQVHIVPLSRQALAVLKELHPATGHGTFLFPSVRTGARPMSDMTVNAALRVLGYAQGDMTGHGFRSMASTLLNEQGYNRDWIERQLAHGEHDPVRAAYNYAQYLLERRRMMQEWADYLDSLRDGAMRGNGVGN
jgi:integrase